MKKLVSLALVFALLLSLAGFAAAETDQSVNIGVTSTLTTLNQDLRKNIRARLNALTDNIALAHGCTADIQWLIGPDPVINDPGLCEKAAEVARELGLTVKRQDNTMGGEDFSEYLKICPGVFVRVGTGGGYTNHHPKFTADERALWPAAQFFAELALRRAGADTSFSSMREELKK